MKRWLFAAVITSAVVPSAVALLHARGRAVLSEQRSRDAIGDVLVDEPETREGIRNPYTVTESIRSVGVVAGANAVSSGPVVVAAGDRRQVVRLEGFGSRSSRLARLRRVVVEGDPARLGTRGRVALGRDLARALDVDVGDEIRVLGLSPGRSALGFRRRTFEVACLLQADLAEVDGGLIVTTLQDAASLLGRDERIDGVQARLTTLVDAGDATKRLERALRDERRVRHRDDRDRPRLDGVATVAAAQSTMLLALVVAFLALPLCGLRKAPSYRDAVILMAPTAGIALAASVAGAVATVALFGEHGVWDTLVASRADLGRLVLGTSLGLLASPLLVGRFGKVAAGPALAVIVALGTLETVAAAVVANGSARTALRHEREAGDLGAHLASGPLTAMASRGGEHVPVVLLGVDPESSTASKALGRWIRGGETPRLRADGAERPLPWKTGGAAVEDLLDRLAATGDAMSPADGDVPEGETPTIVLGWAAARRLGAAVGDDIHIAAAPAGVDPANRVDPPWPRTFRVAAVLRPALRSVQGRLAVADTWQVEALGGAAVEGRNVRLRAPPGVAQRVSRPFALRATRAAWAAALQIVIVAFLLGVLAAETSRTALRLAGWAVLGLIGGLLLGFNEGAGGLVGIGHAAWYEVLPSGSAGMTDVLHTMVPFVTSAALTSAAFGVVFSLRRKGRSEEPSSE